MPPAPELPPYDKIEVGKRIVLLRSAANNMQQKDLAEAIGISPQKLNNYEKGRDQLPIPLAVKICILTGANFDYLYRGLMGALTLDLAARLRQAGKAIAKPIAKRAS